MKKIIITSGGTSERIDNVRKITNSSSGKLGMTIANHLLEGNNDIMIYYVCSKNSLAVKQFISQIGHLKFLILSRSNIIGFSVSIPPILLKKLS